MTINRLTTQEVDFQYIKKSQAVPRGYILLNKRGYLSLNNTDNLLLKFNGSRMGTKMQF